ncbi:MAG: serine hydrolase domain-containing protein [Rhodoglobus sp.]
MVDFTRALDKHLDTVSRRRRGLPAPQVLVHSQSRGIDYSYGDRAQPFHAASIGKVVTAALVMDLVPLDTTVQSILGPQPGLLLGDATVGQLLEHTSGAADYFDDPVTSGPKFQKLIASERDRLWTPADLLEFSRSRQKPVGMPGEKFHYSDTGYVLAGRIAEELTGQPFHELVRSRIFEPLGMANSWYPHRESGPAIAPLWLGRDELSTAVSVSCDWAGGGIATTLDDLVRLSAGIQSLEARAEMARMRNRFRPGMRYGAGLMELRFEEFFPLLRGMPRPTGHIGVLATHMFYDADNDTHFAMNFHSTREMVRSFKTLIFIEQLLAKTPERV